MAVNSVRHMFLCNNGLRKTGYDVDVTIGVGCYCFHTINVKTISLFMVILH